MLDEMNLRQGILRETESFGKRAVNVVHLSKILRPVHDVADAHSVADRERRLAGEIRFRIAAHADVSNLRSRDPRNVETLLYRGRGKTGPVLDPPEPLFFDGDVELSVAKKNRRTGIVIGVYSKYIHASDLISVSVVFEHSKIHCSKLRSDCLGAVTFLYYPAAADSYALPELAIRQRLANRFRQLSRGSIRHNTQVVLRDEVSKLHVW